MNMQRESGDDRTSPRARSGFIVGYIGLVFGLLVVLSMASEVEPLPTGQAALVVLFHMMIGYAVGWLIQPLIARMFPQA
jgi:hypothetical protein